MIILGKDNWNGKEPYNLRETWVKVLRKVFWTVVKEISEELTPLGESGSEFSHFIPEPRSFAEVTKLSENIKKSWLKVTLKEIQNLINNQNFLIEYQNEGEPVPPCMDVYKAKIQSDGSLDNLKLIIVVREDLQNKELVGDTWSPKASMRTLEYFLADATKHKARYHQLYSFERSCKPKYRTESL